MSAAATVSPAMARGSSRHQQSYSSSTSERHQKTPSSSPRSPSTPGETLQSDSYTYSAGRGPPTSQQQSIASVVRRDYETTNVARPPSVRRSSSRDRSYAGPSIPHRSESNRSNYRSDSRSGQPRYGSEIPTTPPAPPHGRTPSYHTRDRNDINGPDQSTTPRRRTAITASTGTWSLNRTIGAGSMGKVKLARNVQTGEQVREHFRSQ
jgi:hypothetical protein